MDDDFKPVRRRLLKALGITLPVSTAVFADAQRPSAPAAAQAAAPTPAPDAAEHVSLFFNADERAAVDAIVARLIPADELGPGAKEAGVTTFLDRQLAGMFGQGANFYRHGPFQQGTPEQGYQLALTPAECYRLGLAGLDRMCASRYGGRRFAQLDAATQDAVLREAEAGKLDLGAVPSAVFFQALLDGAIEGFFSDPVYGGNRNMVGWKLVGFPGAMASFANDIERHNVPYTRPPVSIATAHAHAMPPPRSQVQAQPVAFVALAGNAVCHSQPATHGGGE
ncbi:hypothetical protein R82526_01148 [Ralstonia mannitolilytica]|uniref:gluconate 2-dehydrogenase subunit 3 family protein n=1 Tax=Ralstonia mannitolilytica TaxID=105219 RepID=UPI0007B08235|nr:gluconate 2-dehydrogenase subunit 3 family protein [Ralstonia mannitolilytica]CAJ0681264.1 hypothetical protein R82526_01148 [Ralstonia mannitolilytica]CAJ0890019.1 hypothetical protein R76727_04147 [Ralstonia mannitolilytica]